MTLADDALGLAILARATTIEGIGQAAASAEEAELAKIAAVAAQAAAELARDNAGTTAHLYADVATGRAAVANGEYYSVVGAGDVAFTIYRRVDAGNSTLTLTQPSKAYLDRVAERVRPDAITYELMPPGSGYIEAVLDMQRRRLQAFTVEGWLEARLSPKSVVPRQALTGEVLSSLLPEGVSMISMPAGSGWKSLVITNDSPPRILGGWNDKDQFWTKLADDAVLPQTILDSIQAAQNYLPTTKLAAFGDSITEGVATYDRWTDLLAVMLGVTVSNQGKGSQLTREIAARQGGTPMLVSVATDTIPASGEVAVTAFDVNIGRYGGVPAWLSTTGTLAGVAGTMRGNQDSAVTPGGTYTFVRSTPGAAVACPPNTPFIANAGVTLRGDRQIHDCGRNDVGNLGNEAIVADIINRIISMGSYLSPRIKQRLVIGVYTGPSEYATASGSGATNYNNIIAFNSRLQRELGAHFLDIQYFLINEALAAVGLTPTSNDLLDISRNTVPRSLLHSDQLHLNSYGALAFAIAIARRVRALGWY